MCSVKLYPVEAGVGDKDCRLDEAILNVQNLCDRHGPWRSKQ